MGMIYARQASAEFNARLDATLQRLAGDVKRVLGGNLIALVLGGGYGRGEGGVVRVDGVEQPYNDLDLILVVRRKKAVSQDVLGTICQDYEAELRIQVDFGRPLTLRDIQRWPHWLMWYDLLNGHIVLAGPPDVLRARAPSALQRPLPSIEATRLLLNRGAGLLWAMRVLRGVEDPPDSDFVRRNYFKCILALGDALLIAHGRFATPYRGRDLLLARLTADCAAVAALQVESLYRSALRFKFCPDELTDAPLSEGQLHALAERWGSVFLHVECLRIGRPWASLAEYAGWRGAREAGRNGPVRWLWNALWNRRWGAWSWQYPREHLYRQLPALLRLTGRPVADWPAEAARFLAVWRRFN
ncbi:MAG: hypothetical protein A3F84_05545 [Candidatus Handelsmanbacteria bacterium RIFCSPLOWO2_12_FULL_64_10]|uniref:Polymerase nucleotidyl transferase domain-containing protein n=1 Tax=Handelsmanbacteria sp. (strain RIFCSPLOWO2_12_FULL_64_10) TaxID=1817868 RepID=A0A1F6C628_HANXR|nr:MAG: hypothetical protein A3F84_05545 [Candidatus Handelsmanbacteria bacterium RIFCSPLOWO2_12_FULL_64_10]